MQPWEPQAPQASVLPQGISLDQKVDALLIQYEQASTPLGQQLVEHIKTKGMTDWLFEADPVVPPEPPPDSAGNVPEMGVEGLSGDDSGESSSPEQPVVPPTPKINIDTFAGLMARMVVNHSTLLDSKGTILRRSLAFITKNYGQQVATELGAILETQYELTIRTMDDRQQDSGIAPIAAGGAEPLSAGGA